MRAFLTVVSDLPGSVRHCSLFLLAAICLGATVVQADERTMLCIATDGGSVTINAERAVSNAERSRGLMGRTYLAPSHGMVFVYDYLRPPDATFWMRHTLIPLDIAYIGPDDRIRSIQTMTPCTAKDASDCRSYPAGVHHTRALEMNAGFFSENGVEIGDRMTRRSDGSCDF